MCRVFESGLHDRIGLTCNTEKDRVRVNKQTAGTIAHAACCAWGHKILTLMTITLYPIGIVAGAWPCGIITLLAELYGTESKAQVYGALHTFLQENPDATSELRRSTYLTLLRVFVMLLYLYRFYMLR